MKKLQTLFKALSDQTRLRILSILNEEELCVCDIASTLEMTQPNISFHLNMLKSAGLIKDRKEGRWIHYSLDESDMFRRFLLFGIFEQMSIIPKDKIIRSRKC